MAGDAYQSVRVGLASARLLVVSGRMPGHIPAGRELAQASAYRVP